MAKYSGSIDLISGIRQKNGGSFPLMEASAIQVDDTGKRLDQKLLEMADGFTFDSKTGILQLTSHGEPIEGASATINLNNYYTKEEMDKLLEELANSETIQEIKNNAVGSLNWEESTRELRALNMNKQQIGDPIVITGGESNEYDITYDSETGAFNLIENDEVKSSVTIVGGGGGGGGGSTITLDMITPSSIVVVDGDSAIIQYRFASVDEDNDPLTGTYAWKIDGAVIQGATGECVTGINEFDITKYLTYNDRRFTLVVTDSAGTVKTKYWTARKVDVRLETTFNDRVTKAAGEAITFPYVPYGAGIEKVVHFRLDGVEIAPVVTSLSAISQDYTIPAQEHGAHLLDCWITAQIGSTSIETEHVYKDILCVDEESDIPIIGCIHRCLPVGEEDAYSAANAYYTLDDNGMYQPWTGTGYDWDTRPQLYYKPLNANQYDSTSIEYTVYKPGGGVSQVSINTDGTIRTETTEEILNTLSYRTSVAGTHTIVLSTGTPPASASVGIIMEIAKLDIEITPVTTGRIFDFNPSGYSNGSIDKTAPWADANDASIALTVSEGFDWNNGGFQLDADDNPYFCVKSGNRAYISHELFGKDMKADGAHFKLIFKTENVKNIDASFLSCVSGNVGFEMKVRKAIFSTSSNSVEAPYSEEDVIELEYNVEPIDTTDDEAKALIMIYEDGVAYRPMEYDNSHRLYQNSNPAIITIGSDDCDIWIYRMTANESSLSARNVISNFIADAPSAGEMIARYTRNQIYDAATGLLTAESLAASCPHLKVFKLEAPRFTNNKSDKVPNTNIQCIHKGGDPVLDNWYATGAQHSGQGTTSNEYGDSGRNMDFIMNKGAVITTGVVDVVNGVANTIEGSQVVDKITLTRTSVPTAYLNVKVNIASSENANNSLLQKRFNQFLPYTPVSKKKNPFVKTTMEFVNCVVFIKETAVGSDEEGNSYTRQEFQDGEWHFYAIGNVGDSKKTDDTRACDPNDPREFTNEIVDNTMPNSVFDTGVVNLIVERLPATGDLFTDYYLKRPDGTYTHNRYINGSWKTVETGVTEIINGAVAILSTLPETGEFETDYYIANADGTYTTYRWHNGAYTEGIVRDTVENDHMATAIAPEQWIPGNEKYDALMADAFDGEATFELRYMHKNGDLDACMAVWHEFYKWMITSTDAEFVNEFEDWFIKDAALYFYLFLERYTMTDNPSKNSFWHWSKVYLSTEEAEGAYKDVAQYYTVDDEAAAVNDGYRMDFWDYDNDTGLGINNSGELKMPYGREFIDYFDDDRTKGYVFNGARSVLFRRMRKLMHDDLMEMYQDRESAGAWDSQSLIDEFDAWQAQFPEELWRVDIERKYERTYRGTSFDNSIPKKSDRFMKTMMNGRKKYHRRQFERDQSPYIGTKYLASSVQKDQIMFRCNTPSGVAITPDYTLNIIPYSDMYLSVKHGNSGVKQIRAKAGQSYQVDCPLTTMTDTAILIYSASRIQALNDLSRCYIHDNDFSNAVKLQKLVIGNNAAGYSNQFLEKLSIGNNELLEELNIRNCPNLTGSLNLSALGSLAVLYADGTAINAVTFAENGKLEKAYLPDGITALTMRNLNYIEVFRVSYDTIERLIITGGNLDTAAIASEITDTADEIYLGDVNWTLDTTDVLKKLYTVDNCYVSGDVTITGSIGDYELTNYQEKWGDLVFHTENATIVPYYMVRFLNYDGSVLDIQYVERGMNAEDPTKRADNPISTPERPMSISTIYTFKGWDGSFTGILDNTVITATYSEAPRTYSVKWYNGSTLLQETTVSYGESAEYTGATPTDTSLEANKIFKLFDGWDMNTGFVEGDLVVKAKFVQASSPTDKALADISPEELHAMTMDGSLTSVGGTQDCIHSGDEFDLTLGNDIDFENVDSVEIVPLGSPHVLDGTDDTVIVRDDLRLFADNRPFTIAIDFQYASTTSNGVLVSCYENSAGMRLIYKGSTGAVVRVGAGADSSAVASSLNREMLVIRRKYNDNNLYIYASRRTGSTQLVETIRNTLSTLNNAPLAVGCTVYSPDATGAVFKENYTSGTIHWMKVWRSDLGEDVCKELAAWTRYTITMQAAGIGEKNFRLFQRSDNGAFCNCAFLMKNQLDLTRGMNTSNVNEGGWRDSGMRTWLNSRLYNALPRRWKQIIKQVRVKGNTGNMTTTDIATTDDHIWIPSPKEVGVLKTTAPYASESEGSINFFTDDASRVKYRDNGNGAAGAWWLRSPSTGYATTFYSVYSTGAYTNYGASNSGGVCFGFCI